jgi:activator of HSP90 ATPase
LKESIRLSETFPVSAKKIFDALLNSKEHSAIIGGKAEIFPRRGTKFRIWNGYITGNNIIVQPYGRIVQTWRTKEFPDGAQDSNLEILLEKVNGGTKLTMIHSNLPDGESKKYEKGWKDYYLRPMKKYFKTHH